MSLACQTALYSCHLDDNAAEAQPGMLQSTRRTQVNSNINTAIWFMTRYIFITPRRVRENAEPTWFEFASSFSIDLWMRPQRLFLGTDIEGGILTCLVTDIPLSRYTGYGIVVSGSNREGKVIFRATQGTNQVWPSLYSFSFTLFAA